jgi:cobalt/nickel transport system permease protein
VSWKKRIFAANLFLVFLWGTIPFTVSGEVIFQFSVIAISREGVRLALLATLKCNAILLLFMSLLGNMDSQEIGKALIRLRCPVKLIFLFLFTCRYIHVVHAEWLRLYQAALLRGFQPRTSLHSYKTFADMLGLCLVNSIDRAHRIYEAMLLRGFRGTFHTLEDVSPPLGQGSAVVVLSSLSVVFLALDWIYCYG